MAKPRDVPSLKEVIAVFESNLPSFRCSVCRHDRMGVIDPLDKGLLSRVSFSDGGTGVDERLAKTMIVACQNCGHVNQFILDYFLKAEKELPQETERYD